MEREGIVRISTKETILKQKEAARAAMAAEQELKLTESQLAPLTTEYFSVSYANASKDVLPHITDILTPERGHAKVDERTNQLIMTDIQEKLDMARKIIKEIDKVTPQVMINARIVETSTSFSREFGVEWGMDNTPGTYESDLGGIYNYGVAMNNPAAAASNILGFNFTRITGTPFSLGAWLSLMETVGQVKIISSPRIVTLNKKKATISQGQEIPYTTVDEGEADTEFKDADLKLEVTPQVTPDNRIAMNIHIEEKEVGEQGSFDEPPLNTKEADTELLVNDGDTIVIGGIIQSTDKEGESGVPYLSKIPLLGFLFKYQTRSSENSELLIFITPTIIRLE
jgi:type IV pilus assembly protein PilQ